MKLLEERIKKDGVVLPGEVLKINSFLNHQIDPDLMMAIGNEFANLFKNSKVTKILTCEASGIAPGLSTAAALHVPLVFARKQKPSTITDQVYSAHAFSYTKKVTNQICVEQEFICATDKILIIDDFLAHGEAVKSLINIAKQAHSQIAGIGVVVAKTFQAGNAWLKEQGYHLEALAKISSFAGNQVHFEDEK